MVNTVEVHCCLCSMSEWLWGAENNSSSENSLLLNDRHWVIQLLLKWNKLNRWEIWKPHILYQGCQTNLAQIMWDRSIGWIGSTVRASTACFLDWLDLAQYADSIPGPVHPVWVNSQKQGTALAAGLGGFMGWIQSIRRLYHLHPCFR